MVLKLKCPNSHCGQVLTVQDELAGKKGKCPACGLDFAIPDPNAALTKAKPAQSAPPKRPRREAVEEDLVVLEPVDPDPANEDRPPPRRPPPARRRREPDEDFDNYEEEWEDPEKAGRRRAKTRSAQVRRARLGVFLNFIAAWFYVAATGLLLLFLLLTTVTDKIDVSIFAIAGLPGLVNWILSVVGFSFCVAGPSRYGARGLAIATLAVAGVHVLVVFVAAFGNERIVEGLFPTQVSVNWPVLVTGLVNVTLLGNLQLGVLFDFYWPMLLSGSLELARWILFVLYLRALGRTVRESDMDRDGIQQVILVPAVLGGALIINLMFGVIVKSVLSSGGSGGGRALYYIAQIIFLSNYLAVLLLAIRYLVGLYSAKQTMDYKKTY